jgi:hypothetical protein
MSRELFDFRVDVHVDGYEWVKATVVPAIQPDATPRAFLVPCKIGGGVKSYNPVTKETGLFREFAGLEMREEPILAFANEYGRIQRYEEVIRVPGRKKLTHGDSIWRWCQSIGHMSIAVRLWDMVQSDDLDGLSRHIRPSGENSWLFDSHPDLPPGQEVPGCLREFGESYSTSGCDPGDLIGPAMIVISTIIQMNTGTNADIMVRWCPDSRGMRLYVRMLGLNDAVWFQFAQAVIGNKDYRQCRTCGKWYELHPDTARTNRLSCSDACRSKFYRQRQAEARRLAAQGMLLAEIADQLKADPLTIQEWITRRRRPSRRQ